MDETNKAYYQSPMFGRLLNYRNATPNACIIRERNGRRSFAVDHVATVASAPAILVRGIELDTL